MSDETKQQMTAVDAALMWADDCVKGQKPLGKLFMKKYKECVNTMESLRILAAEVRRLRGVIGGSVLTQRTQSAPSRDTEATEEKQ